MEPWSHPGESPGTHSLTGPHTTRGDHDKHLEGAGHDSEAAEGSNRNVVVCYDGVCKLQKRVPRSSLILQTTHRQNEYAPMAQIAQFTTTAKLCSDGPDGTFHEIDYQVNSRTKLDEAVSTYLTWEWCRTADFIPIGALGICIGIGSL